MVNATETIEITLNGKPRVVPADLTVTGLLEHLELHPRLVVVEWNRHILDGARYDATPVNAGDRIELVHFVGGG